MSYNRRKPSRCPDTRRSLVGRVAASDELTRQQALAELLVTYAPALRYDAQLQLWRKGIMPVSTAPLQRFTPQTTPGEEKYDPRVAWECNI
jgi:hypothetical protein